MLTLEKAIIFATEAHAGQKDKAGQAYILHPLTVMSRMDTDTERIVALLHDVIEGTEWSISDLNNQFKLSEEVILAVNLLTKMEGQDYDKYIEAIKNNVIARKVKIADLEHNMDIKRVLGRRNMTDKDMQRLAKYYKAWSYLTGI